MSACRVCGKPTQFCCSNCFEVFYCRYVLSFLLRTLTTPSAEHQLQDWESGHQHSCKAQGHQDAVNEVDSSVPVEPTIGQKAPAEIPPNVGSVITRLNLVLASFPSQGGVAIVDDLLQQGAFGDEDANLALEWNRVMLYDLPP